MGILAWLGLGLVAGVLGKLLMPGDDPGGIFVTIGLGVAGAYVGVFLGSFVGIGSVTGFNIPSVGTAIAGSMVLLLGYRMVFGRKKK